MENVIYYFTGRGNSLSVAQGLSKLITNTEIRPMSTVRGEVVLRQERVGLILPVIDFGIPRYVRDFLKRFAAGEEKPYLFAVVTCGGMPAASLETVKRMLRKQGFTLSAGWILEFGRRMMTDDAFRMKLDEMADIIGKKIFHPNPPVSLMGNLMTGLLNPLARLMIANEDKKFRVDAGCTGCGVCMRVCPVDNIQIKDGKPVWQHRCEQCAACFSWCPQKAISGTCLAAKTHYQNPKVRLEQLFEQSGTKK